MKYFNYHKHDHYSNARTPDSIAKPIDYINRAKELGHDAFFTTNHGISSNLYESYSLCKDNSIKLIYGIELYYVNNRFEKDRTNNHIVVIAKNYNGLKDINRISSLANIEGFYYHPRIDKELLLSLNPDNVIITTACVQSLINSKKEYKENLSLLLEIKEHFKDNLFLEIQNHNIDIQKNHNILMQRLNLDSGVKLIHANDSHYIEDSGLKGPKGRSIFLKGKDFTYGDEDSFILDYPDSDKIVDRYILQGVFDKNTIISSIENTLVFEQCEDLKLTKDIKMPTMYPNLSNEERYNKLRSIVYLKLDEYCKNKDEDRIKQAKEAVEFELDIIKNTNEVVHTADYFLLNERILDLAINKYNGYLSKTGRGSASGYFINKLLGFTGIDRLTTKVELYPTRFISESRLLETKSLPDFDYNTTDADPFIKASKELLGDHKVYPMIAYGTLQRSAAFRIYCKSLGLKQEDYNEFAKNISELNKNHKDYEDRINELYDDETYGEIMKESEIFLDVVDSISIHPCACLLSIDDIRETLGITKAKDNFVCNIDSTTSDSWKFLKNDYLEVDVWRIIKETYDLIGLKIDDPDELEEKLNESVWRLYDEGITESLNQTSTDFAKSIVKAYRPRSSAELCAFVAAIRPGFASLLNSFVNREEYSTGIQQLDKILEETNHYILYQESVMKCLMWLGIPEDETYGLTKKIAKKSFTPEELKTLESTLKNSMTTMGIESNFDKIWTIIEDNSKYSFNAAHALCVALDSLYSAYLKSHYPLEYFTVCFNEYGNKMDKTTILSNELKYFKIQLKPIKFGYSSSKYTMNKEERAIYKGLSSVKYLNDATADYLYSLNPNNYSSFTSLLNEIKRNSNIDKRKIEILIQLGYFDQFGSAKLLFKYFEIYQIFKPTQNPDGIKNLSPQKIEDNKLYLPIVERHSILSKSGKTYSNINIDSLLEEYEIFIMSQKDEYTLNEKIKFQEEFIGSINLATEKPEDRFKLFIKSVNPKGYFKEKEFKIWAYEIIAYSLGTGKEATLLIRPEKFEKNKLDLSQVILTTKNGIKYTKTKKYENYWLLNYEVVEDAI